MSDFQLSLRRTQSVDDFDPSQDWDSESLFVPTSEIRSRRYSTTAVDTEGGLERRKAALSGRLPSAPDAPNQDDVNDIDRETDDPVTSHRAACHGTVDGSGPRANNEHQSHIWVEKIYRLNEFGTIDRPGLEGRRAERARGDSLRDLEHEIQLNGPYRLEPVTCLSHTAVIDNHRDCGALLDQSCIPVNSIQSVDQWPAELLSKSLYEDPPVSGPSSAFVKCGSKPGSLMLHRDMANQIRGIARQAHHAHKAVTFSVDGFVSWIHTPTRWSTWVQPSDRSFSMASVPLEDADQEPTKWSDPSQPQMAMYPDSGHYQPQDVSSHSLAYIRPGGMWQGSAPGDGAFQMMPSEAGAYRNFASQPNGYYHWFGGYQAPLSGDVPPTIGFVYPSQQALTWIVPPSQEPYLGQSEDGEDGASQSSWRRQSGSAADM
ncbi:hypothetical protein I316_06146 [Kwoniella heveanensis BCC8398]|uniref:Uncharacterized protein n=1 Tax=Kwoniella heveanensis BCC8398 TaxID=1296120 RepID=A0A1B9GMH8_9TREE|nr:hypothetical protein I316_06146 [Kwoniella heveanensis BCC8398]